jgi:hypothetical protein
MPRSHELVSYPAGVPARATTRALIIIGLATCGVAACRPAPRSGANGIETALNTDTASRDTTSKTDTAPPPEPGKVRVSNIMIGRRLGPQNRISEPTLRFAPTDTVFLSIATEGTPDSATLVAKWTFPTGKVQDSASTTIQPKGNELTELHAAPPNGSWPVGSYLVTVYAGGDSVDAKTIAVQK